MFVFLFALSISKQEKIVQRLVDPCIQSTYNNLEISCSYLCRSRKFYIHVSNIS